MDEAPSDPLVEQPSGRIENALHVLQYCKPIHNFYCKSPKFTWSFSYYQDFRLLLIFLKIDNTTMNIFKNMVVFFLLNYFFPVGFTTLRDQGQCSVSIYTLWINLHLNGVEYFSIFFSFISFFVLCALILWGLNIFLSNLCDTPLGDKNSSCLLFNTCTPLGQGWCGIYLGMFSAYPVQCIHTVGTQHVLNQYLLSEWSHICFKYSLLSIVAICALCMEGINNCWLFIMIMMTYGVFILSGICHE